LEPFLSRHEYQVVLEYLDQVPETPWTSELGQLRQELRDFQTTLREAHDEERRIAECEHIDRRTAEHMLSLLSRLSHQAPDHPEVLEMRQQFFARLTRAAKDLLQHRPDQAIGMLDAIPDEFATEEIESLQEQCSDVEGLSVALAESLQRRDLSAVIVLLNRLLAVAPNEEDTHKFIEGVAQVLQEEFNNCSVTDPETAAAIVEEAPEELLTLAGISDEQRQSVQGKLKSLKAHRRAFQEARNTGNLAEQIRCVDAIRSLKINDPQIEEQFVQLIRETAARAKNLRSTKPHEALCLLESIPDRHLTIEMRELLAQCRSELSPSEAQKKGGWFGRLR
jgi:hypothetical protein